MTWRRMCHFHCTELQERLSQGYTAKEQLPVKHEKEKISWDKAIQDSFIYVHYISFWMHLYINTIVFTTLPFKRVFKEYLLLLSLMKEFVTLILIVTITYYLREIIIIFKWYWLCPPACIPAKALPKWGGGGGFETSMECRTKLNLYPAEPYWSPPKCISPLNSTVTIKPKLPNFHRDRNNGFSATFSVFTLIPV